MIWYNHNTAKSYKGKEIKGDSETQQGMTESIQSLMVRMRAGESIPVNNTMFYPDNEDDYLPQPNDDIHEKHMKLKEAESILAQNWEVVEGEKGETSEVSPSKEKEIQNKD